MRLAAGKSNMPGKINKLGVCASRLLLKIAIATKIDTASFMGLAARRLSH